MVQHVTDVGPAVVDDVVVVGDQQLQCHRQGVDGVPYLQDLPHEQVDLLDGEGDGRREHGGLHRTDIVLQLEGHVEVVVDDLVGQGVEHRLRQEHPLEILRDPVGGVRSLTVGDGDDEVPAQNDLCLAGGDVRGQVRVGATRGVVHGAQHEQQLTLVALELRPLMGGDGVFHDEFVDAEDLRDPVHDGFIRF